MAKPDLKLSVKLKDNGERVYPGAAWKSDRGDSFNFKLDDGWCLVAPDGTKYTSGRDGNAYFDVYTKREDGPARKPPEDFGGDFDDASDVPF